ncbi:hypothetical protein BDP27DRAFT_1314965 [Rhodocollybia butyracea]|uniref:Secreted protein n=1 Tax=Rhodocollybia butyracea TaxID=206335 RepID=A0A9P5Q6C6_9AGAR|nr:hypothetical protein BDP27DRAFT_1314965 [Rhodocollybia butyracea]
MRFVNFIVVLYLSCATLAAPIRVWHRQMSTHPSPVGILTAKIIYSVISFTMRTEEKESRKLAV